MAEKLSLFGEENTLFNGAVQRLLEMDFSGCLERLERYRKLFPWGREVRREAAVAAFWRERLGGAVWERIDSAEVERRYGLWLDFEKVFGCPGPEEKSEQEFQVRYFLRLIVSLAASGEETPTSLPGGTPTGLLHLLAGRPSGAIPLLQGLIGAEPENARIYGYLGDAYVLRGEPAHSEDLLPGGLQPRLDTMDKSCGSLTTIMKPIDLERFTNEVKKREMLCGLAGSLRLDDIIGLLQYRPDYLGFRGALCINRDRTAELNKDQVARIKKEITYAHLEYLVN